MHEETSKDMYTYRYLYLYTGVYRLEMAKEVVECANSCVRPDLTSGESSKREKIKKKERLVL